VSTSLRLRRQCRPEQPTRRAAFAGTRPADVEVSTKAAGGFAVEKPMTAIWIHQPEGEIGDNL
jgi:hypothetical protein